MYRGSVGTMKYVPRSCTQFAPRARADLVGIVEDRIVRCEHLHLAVLVGHARVAEARGKRRVLRPRVAAVVLHDHGAAGRRVVEHALVVRAQIFAAVVRAHADEDRVVAAQIAPRQLVRVEQSRTVAPRPRSAAGTSSPVPIT